MANDLVVKFGNRYSVEPAEVVNTLKQTCFQVPVTDAQMMSLLIVADQYNLNPFLKEIYAFPDKRGGIVPVVGIDGWARIINDHPAFDGMEFLSGIEPEDGPWMECRMHRKDRNHPIVIREYLNEVRRATDPWKTHPRRMLRHKTLIQCARIAFGFGGIYDEDEAARILEKDITPPRENAIAIAQQAIAVDDPELRQQLVTDLDAVADMGTAALKAAWQALTPELRKLHGGLSEVTKDRAKRADEFQKNVEAQNG